MFASHALIVSTVDDVSLQLTLRDERQQRIPVNVKESPIVSQDVSL